MQHILLSLIILFSFTSCDDDKRLAQEQASIAKAVQAEKDALLIELKAKDVALQKARAEAKQANEKLLAEEVAKKEAFLKLQTQKEKHAKEDTKNEKLSKVGIHIEENMITIDTNKTKDFFKNIGRNINDKLKKITTELEKGMIDEKEAGVHIDETKINIDLNKTKKFIDSWGKKMQNFAKDFDTMAKDLDTQPKIKTH